MKSKNKNRLQFSKRRRKVIYISSLVNIFSALIFAVVFYYTGFKSLAYIAGFSSFLFLVSSILTKKGNVKIARSLFILNFNLSVAIVASYVGKNASIEFFLLYALGIPFTFFSIRREKIWLLLYAFLPVLLLTLLYIYNFNFFGVEQLDPEFAKNNIYPFSMTFTLLLIVFQLIYFSYINAGFNKSVQEKKTKAIEASNAKSQFLSTMSHEIRTPLNAVIGLSHILGDNNPKEDQIQNIEALNYSGKILLNLLNNVLDFSKMQKDEIELDNTPLDLLAAIKQIKKVHEASCIKKGIDMVLDVDKTIPFVWLDIVRFNQVINNLVTNAIKFTEKGSVTLRITKEKQTNKNVTLLTEVIDTGIGIPADKHETIWEAFSQASTDTNRLYGGTGLGLPIVKSIVNRMGADIKIDSTKGKGSRFYFTLDLPIATKEELKKTTEVKDFNFEGIKVLLVEDNEINVMVGVQILEKANLKVDVALDGLMAVHKAKNNDYDIILMDIQMPILDGYQATKKIREFDKDIPIIALSASVYMQSKNDLEDSKIDGFIFKPFKPQDLLNQIEKFTQ